ncbi:MAG: VWA domain-containing protein [Spongiibacteraceae bacterium]|nr:VWA domain-containing protein [Spongiibacteraceae bacterium]
MFDFFDGAALLHFHFLRPYCLLIILPYIVIIRRFRQRDDSLAMWRGLMSKDILAQLTVSGGHANRLTPKNVLTVLVVVATLVLAGPSWRQQDSPFTKDSSALIIALDVSQTMNQADVQPSRLLRAKQKILELLALRGDANTALVAYSGSAHTVMPITNDSDMIRHFLDSLDDSMMPRSGKLPHTVLPIADQLLQATQVPGTLLLIGDGATSDTVSQFASFFDDQAHQLIVWAIGSTASRELQTLVIPMQLAQLKSLASESGGRLVVMSHNKDDVIKVNHYINTHFVIVEDASRPWFDEGYLLVFVMALLYALWFRRGWTLQW